MTSTPTKFINRRIDVKMNIEDSLRVEESGSPQLQDGCEHREGSRPSVYLGMRHYLFSFGSIYGCELQG